VGAPPYNKRFKPPARGRHAVRFGWSIRGVYRERHAGSFRACPFQAKPFTRARGLTACYTDEQNYLEEEIAGRFTFSPK
jgi:hypothetical protein